MNQLGNDWRALYPFAPHWFDRANGRLHYVDEEPQTLHGDGPAECLLYVHGNPTWSFHWRRFILGLRHQYRLSNRSICKE
jgi:haloalkane dehalogenase